MEAPKKARRPKVKTSEDVKFATYVRKVLHEISAETGLGGGGDDYFEQLIRVVALKIVDRVNLLIAHVGKATVTAEIIENAVRLSLPRGGLAEQAMRSGTRAVEKYVANEGQGSRSTRAGLVFSVSRAERLIRMEACAARTGATAPVFLAAVFENVASDVLTLSAERAKTDKKKRIKPKHISASIRGDEALSKLFADTIVYGGVEEYIHEEFMPKKKKVDFEITPILLDQV